MITETEDRKLPYGGTIRDVRLQIARLAAEAEHISLARSCARAALGSTPDTGSES